MTIEIRYCGKRNYLPRASSLAAEIKQQRGVDSTLTRGSGGEFEITVDGQLIFSKKQQGRFPDLQEVLALIPA